MCALTCLCFIHLWHGKIISRSLSAWRKLKKQRDRSKCLSACVCAMGLWSCRAVWDARLVKGGKSLYVNPGWLMTHFIRITQDCCSLLSVHTNFLVGSAWAHVFNSKLKKTQQNQPGSALFISYCHWFVCFLVFYALEFFLYDMHIYINIYSTKRSDDTRSQFL